MKHQLTKDELDILIQGVQSWETREINSELITVMFDAIIPNQDTKEQRQEKIKKMCRENDEKRNARRERSTLLQAKLIKMKDALDIDSLTES